eukprot:6181241-Pleurochrysis_carterae.AAC.2
MIFHAGIKTGPRVREIIYILSIQPITMPLKPSNGTYFLGSLQIPMHLPHATCQSIMYVVAPDAHINLRFSAYIAVQQTT